jgi:hypothetical protein
MNTIKEEVVINDTDIEDNMNESMTESSMTDSMMSSHSVTSEFTDNSSIHYDDYVDIDLFNLNIHIYKDVEKIKTLPEKIKNEIEIFEKKYNEYDTIIDNTTKENDTIYNEKIELVSKNIDIDNDLILISNKVIPLHDTFNTIKRDEKIMRMNRDIKKNTTRIHDIDKSTIENKDVIDKTRSLKNKAKNDIKILKNIDKELVNYINKLKYYNLGYTLSTYGNTIYNNKISLSVLACVPIICGFVSMKILKLYNK